MKNFIKNKIKVIFAIIVIAVLCISGTVYATTKYLSSDVTYKDTTVENALNDLYNQTYKTKQIYINTLQKGETSETNNISLNLEKGKYNCVYITSVGPSGGAGSDSWKVDYTPNISGVSSYEIKYSKSLHTYASKAYSSNVGYQVATYLTSFSAKVDSSTVLNVSSNEKANNQVPINSAIMCE